MHKRYVVIYKPNVLIIELPEGESTISEQNFQAGEGDIGFCYFEVIDYGIPEDLYNIIHNSPQKTLIWGKFKQVLPSLSTIISEGLLAIGVRV